MKRQPSDAEIDALAAEFRALWRTGDVVGPWLRKHAVRLRELVHGDWSWAAIAAALTRAGITYRTGRPWSAEGLRVDVRRATRPLKRSVVIMDTSGTSATVPLSENTAASSTPSAVSHSRIPDTPTVPRFKPASLRPYEPPHPPTPEDIEERERQQKRIFG